MRFAVLAEFFCGFVVLDDFSFRFAVSNIPQCPPLHSCPRVSLSVNFLLFSGARFGTVNTEYQLPDKHSELILASSRNYCSSNKLHKGSRHLINVLPISWKTKLFLLIRLRFYISKIYSWQIKWAESLTDSWEIAENLTQLKWDFSISSTR